MAYSHNHIDHTLGGEQPAFDVFVGGHAGREIIGGIAGRDQARGLSGFGDVYEEWLPLNIKGVHDTLLAMSYFDRR